MAEALTRPGAHVLVSAGWAGRTRDLRKTVARAVAVVERTFPRAVVVQGLGPPALGRFAGVVVMPGEDLVLGHHDVDALEAMARLGRPALVLIGLPDRPELVPAFHYEVVALEDSRPWCHSQLIRRPPRGERP